MTLRIGYLHSGKILSEEQQLFLRISKEAGLEITMLNISKQISQEEIESMKKCHIIYNDSGENFVIEFIEMFERMGKKVIESSKSYYEDEDKWNFYMKCITNNIPAPKTILLSNDEKQIKNQLEDFNSWPVVLKRVRGTWGQFVEKAENIEEALEKIKKLKEKEDAEFSIIAQEFISSFSYRVTYIGEKIVQTAIKENNSWKCTGVYAQSFKKIDMDPELERIVKNIIKSSDLKIGGIDLLKRGDNWFALELNSEPALDFFESEKEYLVTEIVKLLERYAYDEKKKKTLSRMKVIKLIDSEDLESVIDRFNFILGKEKTKN